ncbi:histone-lysine N-methyltransferase SETMAR [Trichonephila clavipes]|nr:histone-lysine N-methyltransferase SETMAR [Trichonephila clavipes]
MFSLKVDVSYGNVWTNVHDRLRFRKFCAAWVPKQLINQQKELRMGLALQHLFRYQVKQMELDRFKWETLGNPPYSSDMSPCNFHVFGPMKKHLKGKRFNSDDVLKDTVKDWVSSQPHEFWEQGILWHVH